MVTGVKEGDCVYTASIATSLDGGVMYKKHQNFNGLLDGNAMLPALENTSRIDKGQSYIVEQAVHHNLPHGLVVNSCCVITKARRIPVILINITNQIIWVRHPLLATELFEVKVEPQRYHTKINWEGNEMVISFILVAPYEEQEQAESNAV